MTTTADFLYEGGVREGYGERQELYRTPLDPTRPWSAQVFGTKPVADVIAAFCRETPCVRLVLAGWIDQAVVEIRAVVASPAELHATLDEYRPDQGGDVGLYFCNQGDMDILGVTLSEEAGELMVVRYRKSKPDDLRHTSLG